MHYPSQLVVGSPTLRPAAVVAITAVLILALGGAAIADASPVPSPAPVPPVAPTWVTGHLQPAPDCADPTRVVDGDVTHIWDQECGPQTWTSSDPRLAGQAVERWNDDEYRTDEGTATVSMDAIYLRNDGGGWACSDSVLFQPAGMTSNAVTRTFECVGEGGYAGLSALLVLQDLASDPYSKDIVGLIFSGDFPPLPEAPAAQ